MSTWALDAAQTAINDIYDDCSFAKSKPIKDYIQVGKIILWLFGTNLIISALMRSSPILLPGGLGAFSAVLLLAFRDTLLGLFASVQFVTNDMIRIGDWIEMPEYNAHGEVFDKSVQSDLLHHLNSEDVFAGHNITQLGAFRAYIFGYLKNHPKINPEMEILGRHMAPTQNGLPLEIYAFSKDKRWEDFEDNQAEIFDHLLAILPEFDLAPYQNASGMDIRSLQQYQIGQKLFVQ